MPGGRPPKKVGTQLGDRTYKALYERAADGNTIQVEGTVEAPPADEGWSQEAKDFYNSLAQSAQAHFYEPSDWMQARMCASIYSELSTPRPLIVDRELIRNDDGSPIMVRKLPAQVLQALFSGMADLGVSVGARRRMKLEVERKQPTNEKSADVVNIAI